MFGAGKSRADSLRLKQAELIVDLILYPTEKGGRATSIGLGWGCPCTLQRTEETGWVGYDGWPLLGDQEMAPGESRRVGYVFLSGQEAAEKLSETGKFYIWEGRIIGEAEIVTPGL